MQIIYLAQDEARAAGLRALGEDLLRIFEQGELTANDFVFLAIAGERLRAYQHELDRITLAAFKAYGEYLATASLLPQLDEVEQALAEARSEYDQLWRVTPEVQRKAALCDSESELWRAAYDVNECECVLKALRVVLHARRIKEQP